jgi:hypothetical protein
MTDTKETAAELPDSSRVVKESFGGVNFSSTPSEETKPSAAMTMTTRTSTGTATPARRQTRSQTKKRNQDVAPSDSPTKRQNLHHDPPILVDPLQDDGFGGSPSSIHLEDRVRAAHCEISKIWPKKALKKDVCSVETALLAHRYYMHHLPKGPVQLLVLAESHAATDENIVGLKQTKIGESQAIHLGHLNLVHCLSYGEPWILDSTEEIVEQKNAVCRGTPQFWKLLSTLAGELENCEFTENTSPAELFPHLVGGGLKERKNRLDAKARVFEKLKQRGVMFADVSPISIYTGGGKEMATNKTTGKEYWSYAKALGDKERKAILTTAWNEYAQHLVEHIRPRYLVILGKTTEKALGKKLLEKATKQLNIRLLPVLPSPSWNGVWKKDNMMPFLKTIRECSRQALAEGVDVED